MDAYSIQQKLQNVNLSPEEALIYFNLLKLGEVPVSSLAKICNFKRSTTYVYLQSLETKSLVQWSSAKHGKTVLAVDPNQLSKQIEMMKDNLTQAEISYRQILPQLNLLKKQKNYQTEVKYYRGISGLKQLLEHSLEADKNIYGYSSFGRNEIFGIDYMKVFRQKHIDRRLFDSVITNNSQYHKNYPKKVGVTEYLKFQQVRYLPKNKFYISSDIIIYNDVYAVASLDEKNLMGVEIINEEIVKTQMSIFNYMWQIAKPVKWKIS